MLHTPAFCFGYTVSRTGQTKPINGSSGARPDWSFVKKYLYLVITQKLIFWILYEIQQISHEIRQTSCEIHLKTLKSNDSRKKLQFHGVQWEGYVS